MSGTNLPAPRSSTSGLRTWAQRSAWTPPPASPSSPRRAPARSTSRSPPPTAPPRSTHRVTTSPTPPRLSRPSPRQPGQRANGRGRSVTVTGTSLSGATAVHFGPPTWAPRSARQPPPASWSSPRREPDGRRHGHHRQRHLRAQRTLVTSSLTTPLPDCHLCQPEQRATGRGYSVTVNGFRVRLGLDCGRLRLHRGHLGLRGQRRQPHSDRPAGTGTVSVTAITTGGVLDPPGQRLYLQRSGCPDRHLCQPLEWGQRPEGPRSR